MSLRGGMSEYNSIQNDRSVADKECHFQSTLVQELQDICRGLDQDGACLVHFELS